ncbi:MAG: hypothetical protein WD673_15625 [Alphaproteobacteria bacterium]
MRWNLIVSRPALTVVAACIAGTAPADEPARLAGESSVAVRATPDGTEITTVNTTFVVAGGYIPGLALDDRLVLRQRIETVQVIDEKGARSTTVTAEAWHLDGPLDGPPLWSVTAPGDAAEVAAGEFYVVHDENTDWFYPPVTAYRLADGKRLFAATTPWASFQLSTPDPGSRHGAYATAQADEVAADVAAIPFAVGLITYATSEWVLDRVVIEAATEELGYALREVEETPIVSWRDGAGADLPGFALADPDGRSGLTLAIDFPFNGFAVTIPVVDDRLAVAEAAVPEGLRLVPLPAP